MLILHVTAALILELNEQTVKTTPGREYFHVRLTLMTLLPAMLFLSELSERTAAGIADKMLAWKLLDEPRTELVLDALFMFDDVAALAVLLTI